MTAEELPIGRLVSVIVSVLALALVLSIAGVVVLGLTSGDGTTATTLTHVIETVMGVFVGIAAGRLAGSKE